MKYVRRLNILIIVTISTLVVLGNSRKLSMLPFISLVTLAGMMLYVAYLYSLKKLERDELGYTKPIIASGEYIKNRFKNEQDESGDKSEPEYNHETLTSQDIAFFNEEMGKLNEYLDVVERGIKESDKIKDVMCSEGRLKAINLWMDSLFEEPERLIETSDFLYKQLPVLAELVKSYLSIKKNGLLSNKQKRALKESLEAMAILADNIKEGYFDYGDKELNELERKIKHIKKERNQKHQEGFNNEY